MPNLLKYPTTTPTTAGIGSAGSWLNPSNIFADDAAVASTSYPLNGGGSKVPIDNLIGRGFGYALPSTAIIEGIKVEYKVTASNRWNEAGSGVRLQKAGVNTGSNKAGTGSASGGVWSYGGATDLWGTTWTPAEINASNFGVNLDLDSITSSPADYNMSVDYVRVTVYYHIGGSTTPADVPTREVYKVRNQRGDYIGLMPKPVEALKLAQDMNSLGSQITLKVPVSIDTIANDSVPYTTEDLSANYTDESGLGNYVSAGDIPIVSAAFQGIDTLIKNGNTVECWLYNYWYPNGKCMFIGKIRRWEDDDEANCVNVTLYSSSYDLDNYYTRGAPFAYTADVTQNSQNASVSVDGYNSGWNRYGQTWVAGAGVTKLGAISLLMTGAADVTVAVYDGVNGTLLGTTTQAVNTPGAGVLVQFGFANLITVVPGNTYFFTVAVGTNQQLLQLFYNTADVYANGQRYSSSYGGGSGGGSYAPAGGDLYFIASAGTASTTATFTSKDPTTQMLAPIITDYNERGGTQKWTAVTIDATGLSLTYTFSVQTIYQAMQAILDMSPAGFYFYIDIGAQIIYFKNASTTADFLLQKGVHLSSFKLGATTEQSVNTLPFTGGEVTAGVNLYKLYTNAQSIAAFGPLLKPTSDNRVKLDATADAIGNSTLAEFAGEKYFTTVTVVHTTKLDITLLTPGKTVGFRGFGTFKDQIVAQIVRREWSAGEAVLTLGVLPMRLSTEVAQMLQDLRQEQTQYNPSTPS